MKNRIALILGLICLPFFAFSQEEEEEKKYIAIELNYMAPAKGKAADLEAAIFKHNEKFHKEGTPYSSRLWRIRTGDDAGWYVWAMGNFTFSELDDAPGQGEHMEDWMKNVDPYVGKYGRVEYWRYMEDMSVAATEPVNMEINWFVDVNYDEYYRFRDFMEKVQKIHKEDDRKMHVWMNQFNQGDGRDVAISWPMDGWADMDKDRGSMQEKYDQEYGPMAWGDALREFRASTDGLKREVWEVVEK
jgi:hypothetical protein